MRVRVTTLKLSKSALSVALLFTALAPTAIAQSVLPGVDDAARARLKAIYQMRTDLQAVFGPDGVATPAMKARGLSSLDEWARLYGSKEHPAELGVFADLGRPRALQERPAAYVPTKATKASFSAASFSATSYVVIDEPTRKVLFSKNADKVWPLASISKLMTAKVSLEKGLTMQAMSSIIQDDEVGGARLRVSPGTPLSVRQIFDSMLVGSANNAANAVARASGLTKPQFVQAMNAKAREMGLGNTTFVDPSGIEVENVSTATEVAALALEALDEPEVARATTTTTFNLVAAKESHTIKTTDWLLRDNNGLYVMGGKTGYLDESGWNFVVKVKDSRQRPLIVVVLGSSTQSRSFSDTAALAKWTWANYKWVPALAQK